MDNSFCLDPKVPYIASLRKIRQESRAIVDEVANAFAQDWVLRYSIEDFEINSVRGNIGFLKRNPEAYEHHVLHTSRADLRSCRPKGSKMARMSSFGRCIVSFARVPSCICTLKSGGHLVGRQHKCGALDLLHGFASLHQSRPLRLIVGVKLIAISASFPVISATNWLSKMP